MAHLPLVLETQGSPSMKLVYLGISQAELATTYQTVFASQELASQLANLDELLCNHAGQSHGSDSQWL